MVGDQRLTCLGGISDPAFRISFLSCRPDNAGLSAHASRHNELLYVEQVLHGIAEHTLESEAALRPRLLQQHGSVRILTAKSMYSAVNCCWCKRKASSSLTLPPCSGATTEADASPSRLSSILLILT